MTGLRLLYTVTEVAELLGVSRSTAYALAKRQELPTTLIGQKLMVTRPALTGLLGIEPPWPYELDALRDAQQVKPTPVRPATPPPLAKPTDTAQQSLPFRAS